MAVAVNFWWFCSLYYLERKRGSGRISLVVLILILIGKLALQWQYIFGGSASNITWKDSVAVVVYLWWFCF